MTLLAAVIFEYCERGIGESDIWWHLRNAQALLQSHSWSSTDTYSFTAAGSPWINFEWLSEIPYFISFNSFGLQGLFATYFILLVAIFSGLYYRCCRTGADCKDAAIVTLGAICLGGVSMAPRTLLLGWLCMVLLLLVLDQFRRTGSGLWVLPILFALWINFHGSWVFGMIVLGMTIASGLAHGKWGLVMASHWSSPQLKALLVAFSASLIAIFLNPYGYKLVLYPFRLLFLPRGVVEFIQEWQPVDFGTLNGKLGLGLVFVLLTTVLFSRRLLNLDEVLLAVFALWEALLHVRFLFFAGLIMAPIVAPRLKIFQPYARTKDKPWLNATIMLGIIGAIVFSFPSSADLQKKLNATYPKGALEFMRSNGIQGRIFNQYAWGGYMEWHTPEYKTFIDGRADIFLYNGTFQSFIEATALKNSLGILDRYEIEYVLFPPREPLSYLLKHSEAWQEVYEDQVAALFKRRHSHASR